MSVVALPTEDLTLSEVHYLPSEVLKKTNYPEVAQFSDEIPVIMTYTNFVQDALTNYNQGLTTTIVLNADELKNCIDLTRTVLEVLGRATKVCFDIVIPLRKAQRSMQDVYFLYEKYGSSLVGDDTSEGSDT